MAPGSETSPSITKLNDSAPRETPTPLPTFNRDEFYLNLINVAPYIPGDSSDLVNPDTIPWFDSNLMKEGLWYGRMNIFSIVLANTAALTYGFSVKPESVVLIRSGKFLRAEDSFRRYLSTARRIGNWYIYGLTDEKSIQNIQALRALHHHYAQPEFKRPLPTLESLDCTPDLVDLAEAIRDDLQFLDVSDAPANLLTWDPPLPFSQFDMAMTQFGFIAIAYLHPKSLGISCQKRLQGFLHFWAVIGRLLGLEDRFNLALHPDYELYEKLYVNVVLASLKSTDEVVVCLQHALMQGLSRRLPWISLKGWIYYGLQGDEREGFEFKGENIWKLMGPKDKICFWFMKGSTSLIYNFTPFKVIANIFTVILLELAYWIYLPKS